MDIFAIHFLLCKRTRCYQIGWYWIALLLDVDKRRYQKLQKIISSDTPRLYCHVQICLTYRRWNGWRKITGNKLVHCSRENVCLYLQTIRTRRLFFGKNTSLLWLKWTDVFAWALFWQAYVTLTSGGRAQSSVLFAGSPWSSFRRQFAFTTGRKGMMRHLNLLSNTFQDLLLW